MSKKVLYLVHAYHNRGGVEEHTKALSAGLAPDWESLIVAHDQNSICCYKDGVLQKTLEGDEPRWPTTSFVGPKNSKALQEIVLEFEPDIVHIQHILNWHLGVINDLCDLKRPLVLSLHDYYFVTPHFTMQAVEHPKDTLSPEYSTRVFASDISPYLLERRKFLIDSLSKVDRIIVPSRFLALEMARAYPRQYHVIEHGIESFAVKPQTKSAPGVVFGYVGSLIPQKGWKTLLEAFSRVYQLNPDCELKFFGGGEAPPEPPPNGVSFAGRYDRNQLPEILGQFDIGVIPSEFRETYCYVLSEMFMGKKVVAAANIGALADRVKDGTNGKLFSPGNAQSLCDTLLWFLEHAEWRSWKPEAPRTLEEMLEEYKHYYRDTLI